MTARVENCILALTLATIVVVPCSAQDSILSSKDLGSLSAVGTVTGPTAEPVPGVPIEVVGPEGTTLAVTDEQGKWSVYNLPRGKYEVKALDAYSTESQKAVTFTVKEKTLGEKLFGSSEPKTFQAPPITVKEFIAK